MGGVQAKPERRPVLERKTSFAKNHRIVPINSEPRIFEELMRSYQADCKDDKELQDFDAELSSGAEEVVRSTGLDRFKQCLKYLTHSNEKIVRVILSCKKQIVEAEGVGARMVMTANEQLLDQFLIKEYFNNSLQTLQLCRLELQDFINSAREVHSCITDVVLDWEVSKKLNESQKMYHRSAEAVVAKVKSLRDQHRDMLDKLKDRIVKFDRKLELTRTLKKVVNVVFMGMLSGLFVCTIMAAAMAAPPVASAMTSHPCIAGVVAGGAVGYAFSAVLKEGQHWLLTFIQGYKSTLEAHTGVIKSMEAGTRDAIKELDDIMCHVNKVIAKGNDPVLSNLSSTNDEGRVDVVDQEVTSILEKLAEFGKEIEELDEKREQCLRVIETARDKVLGEYGELKSSPVWNTKIKK
ncbi:hypothetical protein RchiOBHm_Chr0c38g0503041 [Rosa chinensis]|uniref:Uncharacterized protein n=1 Tax=Rosa chinensis TaxID=74649 RepID=A0A2P6SQ81_ROSCH|nr:UPF0496 protein At4g34320 [Rosa chinensis]PRQ60823.1 hypothetical protein RchiOBHm_Chr0c38g0503041 [Rosa chinensis]